MSNQEEQEGEVGREDTAGIARSDSQIEHQQLTSDQLHQLHRIRILEEIKGEVISWAKKSLWLLVAVVSIVGFFGVNALLTSAIDRQLDPLIQKAQEEVIRSALVVEEARKASETAKELSDSAQSQIAQYSDKFDDLEGEAKSLQEKYKSVSGELEGEASNLRAAYALSTSTLENKIKRLERLIEALAEQSGKTTRGLLSKYQELDTEATTREDQQKRRFKKNSQFSVTLFEPPADQKLRVQRLSEKLTATGFKVSSRDYMGYAKKPYVVGGKNTGAVANEIKSILSSTFDTSEFLFSWGNEKIVAQDDRDGQHTGGIDDIYISFGQWD